MTIQDIYKILDRFAPFSLQESYDNSGLLAGDPQAKVHRILLTLDITTPVVLEAAEKQAELILSHHPVIWNPLKAVTPPNPVWHLLRHQIGAICSHTCLDIAEGGLNDYVGRMLSEQIAFAESPAPLALLPGGRTLGRTAALTSPCDAQTLAQKLNRVFGCADLRYFSGKNAPCIRKIAWCTGSGGDLITDAITAGADALITGDCKHSVWADAQNRAFTLFDCGHFETEVPVVRLFSELLSQEAPGVELLISEAGTKPFFTVSK
ncbi:MAG: Nif3-like dinuclear metal center hexameric protein [Oscillospiraceae bacterium]|nr:Nif3-like dinuclear metal center hexameric protein [Oscillospiraceae bacterium]